MGKFYTACLSVFLTLCCVAPAIAQKQMVDAAKKQELDRIAVQANQAYTTGRQKALSLATSKGWPLIAYTKGGNIKVLQGVNKLGSISPGQARL
jgi:hypothetical protein